MHIHFISIVKQNVFLSFEFRGVSVKINEVYSTEKDGILICYIKIENKNNIFKYAYFLVNQFKITLTEIDIFYA